MQKIIVNHQPVLSINVETVIELDANTEKRMKADLCASLDKLPCGVQLGLMQFIQQHCEGATQDRKMVVLARALELAKALEV